MQIRAVTALTPALYVGATGTFSGESLSGSPLTLTGTVTRIREAGGWAVVDIQLHDGTTRQIRV